MARPSEAYFEAARRLLAQASAGDGNFVPPAHAAERVFAELNRCFAPVIGAGGFIALLGRSVKLAKVEFPALAGTEPLKSETRLVGQLVDRLSQLEPGLASTAATSLLARLFALMSTFIGEQLVWQIMKSAFPAIDEAVLKTRQA